MPSCAFCGQKLHILDKVFRMDECEHCGGDLHACVQCRFYEPGRHNDCREPRAERVLEKDKVNYCDYFEIRQDQKDIEMDPAASAKAALEALFKK
jgi:hypothetical protein